MKISLTQIKAYISEYIYELVVVILMLIGYVANISIFILMAFISSCVLIMFSKYDKSILYLVFFTSFSSIYFYKGIQMYFILVVLFILRSAARGNLTLKTLSFYFIITLFCILFRDYNSSVTVANTIGVILLFAIPLIANYLDKTDCKKLINHYIAGFVIATIIGFFVMDIPAMLQVFNYDFILTSTSDELVRFFGIAYDSNFYSLSNYIIVAYLLFSNRKLDLLKGILVIFMIISGLQTFSKSYILVVAVLLVLYILRNSKNIMSFVITIIISALGIVVFLYLSKAMGYNVVNLTLDRFEEDGIASQTTGRTEIWKSYLECIKNANLKEFLFGFGFNASVSKIIKVAAHNTYIEFVFFYGIVGSGLWLAYFIYCVNLFFKKNTSFTGKTSLVTVVLIVGIFFLSAYTYEAFWISIVITGITFRKTKILPGGKRCLV